VRAGRWGPILYIPEKDPVQEALEKTKKTNYFKLTLPHTSSELKVLRWESRTPEEFILHVRSAIHACKQMEHDIKFSRAEEAVANAILDLEIKKRSMHKFAAQREKEPKGIKEKAYLLSRSP